MKELLNYDTGAFIREATDAELDESLAAGRMDGGAGVIRVDGVRCYVSFWQEWQEAEDNKPEVHAECGPAMAAWLDPDGALQGAGLLRIAKQEGKVTA